MSNPVHAMTRDFSYFVIAVLAISYLAQSRCQRELQRKKTQMRQAVNPTVKR